MTRTTGTNVARLWTAPGFADVRLLAASFTSYAYEPHVHDEYVLGVVEWGVQRFLHRDDTRFASAGTLYTINPGDVHAGRAEMESGYAYRAAYVSADFLREAFAGHPLADAPLLFAAPDVRDLELAGRFDRALTLLEAPGSDLLAAQSAFILTLRDLFARHARAAAADGLIRGGAAQAGRLVEYLRTHAAEGVSLDDLAAVAGLSKYHALRVFKAATGLSPHAYLVQRRVELARRAMEDGATPAEAALASGFADQSHMTRRFKAMHGVTPGAYRRQIVRP
ncbi:AraC-like DNA-binding protein [Desulfobaculum xiamenense]|uniref:AraC-like DNA-binding protein n=1 Tax=Desulfobaculum xiamenense TaxID=995050 RepID=A0A846QJJ7_9BACT|nr:AraC family transcriptional regulator [Desulfobaculum xiamenense]NJB66652.1 AraC-like DNA-binding protein [Desulfobaculum xiamenense]